jgi:hypothetical protein
MRSAIAYIAVCILAVVGAVFTLDRSAAQIGPYTGTGALVSPLSPPITTVSVGGSPWNFSNTLGYSTNLYLVGGTCSNVAFARNGTSVNVATACATSGLQLEVGPGDTVTVTYSVIPTAYSIPITPNR